MPNDNALNRFIDAQTSVYLTALTEIRNGRKRSHWMWYIFPQIQGLGFSETSKYYAIKDLTEAETYLKHSVLGKRLIEICKALLKLETNNAGEIFGSPDDLKLRSSVTLFAAIPQTDPVFQPVLKKFFNGAPDHKTLQIIKS